MTLGATVGYKRFVNYPMSLRPIRLVVILLLAAIAGQAAMPDVISRAILESPTMMVLFHSGRADALLDAELMLKFPELSDAPLRTAYLTQFSMVRYMRFYGSTGGEAYFLGRASMFWDLAEEAGEPRP